MTNDPSTDRALDRTVAPPIPRRPPAGGGRRARRSRRGRWTVGLLGATLVAAATALVACRPSGPATADAPRPAPAPVQPRRPAGALPVRWGVERLADPTALLVDGDDAFVVEPFAVSSIGVADGTTRWRVDVKDAEPFLAADRDTVLVAAVDGFEALDRATGKSRWRNIIEDPYDRGRTVGLVRTPGGVVAIGTTERGGVVGFEAATGTVRWSLAVPGSPRGQVVADDRTGLVAVELDHEDRVELRVIDGATGTQRWSTALGPMTGWPLVDDTRLVLDTGGIDGAGTVIAFDLDTGNREWEAPVEASSEAGQGGVVDGPNVVMVDGFGTVTALDRRTGARAWRTDLPMPVFHGRPVLVDRVMLLRDISGVFHVLDRRDGRRRASFRTTGIGVGLGAGPSGLVFARARVGHHQVVGLPHGVTTMRNGHGGPVALAGGRRAG